MHETFAGVGWAAVTVILGNKAFHELVPAIPEWLCALVVVALQLVVAVYGYNMIHYLQRILNGPGVERLRGACADSKV